MYSQGNNRVKAKIKTSLVQLVERRSPKPDVVGSSPTGRGFFLKKKLVVIWFYALIPKEAKGRCPSG